MSLRHKLMQKLFTDKELVEGVILGNPKFQKELYSRYSGALFAICKRYAKNTAEAEDLMQDVFVKIFLNLHQFRFESSLGFWAKRLTINSLLNYIKKKNIENNFVSTDEYDNEIQDVRINDDVDVPYEVLLNMVQKLPLGYRTVFNMKEIDGYENKEIASLLGCTESTVRTQLFKAKKELKQKIEKWSQNEIK
ncbi:MAG: sigma-70 family RNA polymerase sigma factor [Bacteroidales bacterium]|nr:sigma-70 family RNA polymerase sigma factor [Bacteroidales bacterium]